MKQVAASFVIPVLNEQAIIGELLLDLRQRFPDCELLVVDGGSSDRTVAVAMPLCDQLMVSDPGRAKQMNLGGLVASSEYVFFLHADSCPGLSATELQTCLAQLPEWGFCRVRLSGRRPWFRLIEWSMNQRSRLTHVATGDQMIFVRKTLFDSSGGFESIPLMEDVEFCKRLRRLSSPHIFRQPVLTSSRRWEEGGVALTVLRMWLLRLAYFLGVSPQRLWRHYYGR